jgi:peptidoglycan-associated lipoprotein
LLVALTLGSCARDPNLSQADNASRQAAAQGAGAAAAFAATAGDRIYFESDSSDLTAVATATLDKQASWLTRNARHQITIEGHADERGTREYNFALGARRAEAAKNYLAAKGVPAGRMRTVSYGKERPVSVCDDISCWSQNRRAVTVLGGAAGS